MNFPKAGVNSEISAKVDFSEFVRLRTKALQDREKRSPVADAKEVLSGVLCELDARGELPKPKAEA